MQQTCIYRVYSRLGLSVVHLSLHVPNSRASVPLLDVGPRKELPYSDDVLRYFVDTRILPIVSVSSAHSMVYGSRSESSETEVSDNIRIQLVSYIAQSRLNRGGRAKMVWVNSTSVASFGL
jgi:hypothetical protein